MSSLTEYSRDNLDARFLLTFYGSQYDVNGLTTQKTDPFIVPDDSSYANHADCYDYKAIDTYPGYRLDGIALPDKASDEEHAIRFLGFVDKQPVKTILAIEASESLFLEKREYSGMFFFQADSGYMKQYGNETYFYRRNLFSITKSYSPSSTSTVFNVVVKNPVDNSHTTKSMSIDNDINGLIVFRVKQEGSTVYATVLRNGVVIGNGSWDVGHLQIDLGNTSTTYIGGLPESQNGDRMERTCRMQYIAFFTHYLSDLEISGLLKRSYEYRKLFDFSSPQFLMSCQDTDFLNTSTVALQKGSGQMLVYGEAVKGSTGLDVVDPTIKSIYFGPTSSVYYRYPSQNGSYPTFFNGNTCTIEMWVRTTNTTSCTLLSMVSLHYDGQHPLTIRLNRASGTAMTGSIEVSDEQDSYANSIRGQNFTDGKWHHIQVQITKSTVQLNVDGVPHGSYKKKSEANRIYSDFTVMADSNNRNNVVGDLAYFSFSNRVDSNIFSNLKYSYNLAYVIIGRTTLSGAPEKSHVRIYDYQWGTFLQEVETKPSGDYKIYLSDSRRVMVSVLKFGDTRYNPKSRVVSPMIISEGN